MLKLIYLIFGLLSFFNGAWMLLFPLSWYTDLPAAVPQTGPFNPHFVRVLGSFSSYLGLHSAGQLSTSTNHVRCIWF
jgi:hypothetical protein